MERQENNYAKMEFRLDKMPEVITHGLREHRNKSNRRRQTKW